MCNEYEQYPFPREEVDLWIAAGRSLTPDVQKTIDGMMAAMAKHSPLTAAHSERVAGFVGQIAKQARLPELAIIALTQAARLHDIGKLNFPKSMVDSSAQFSPDDYTLFKNHAVDGADMILLHQDLPNAFRVMAADMAIGHHENFLGGGYPHNLSQQQIPTTARLVAPADTLDALANRGGYQKALGVQDTLTEMHDSKNPRMAGRFDPEILTLLTQALMPHRAYFQAEMRASTRPVAGLRRS